MSWKWAEQTSSSTISVHLRAGLWQDVLFDLLKLKDLDEVRLGSLALIDEILDAIVNDESETP